MRLTMTRPGRSTRCKTQGSKRLWPKSVSCTAHRIPVRGAHLLCALLADSTTGGCIGMAAVGSALPMLGVVPLLNPWIPAIGMIVSATVRHAARSIADKGGRCTMLP
jgi:hypothetical protein